MKVTSWYRNTEFTKPKLKPKKDYVSLILIFGGILSLIISLTILPCWYIYYNQQLNSNQFVGNIFVKRLETQTSGHGRLIHLKHVDYIIYTQKGNAFVTTPECYAQLDKGKSYQVVLAGYKKNRPTHVTKVLKELE